MCEAEGGDCGKPENKVGPVTGHTTLLGHSRPWLPGDLGLVLPDFSGVSREVRKLDFYVRSSIY